MNTVLGRKVAERVDSRWNQTLRVYKDSSQRGNREPEQVDRQEAVGQHETGMQTLARCFQEQECECTWVSHWIGHPNR